VSSVKIGSNLESHKRMSMCIWVYSTTGEVQQRCEQGVLCKYNEISNNTV
jgi:hypothetical protein